MKNTKHIAIYEPNANGHRYKYVQYIVHELKERNDITLTLITTHEAAASDGYYMYLAPLRSKYSLIETERLRVQDIQRVATDLKTDLIIVPDGDAIVHKLLWWRGWKGPGEVSALIMRPTAQSGKGLRRTLKTMTKHVLGWMANKRRNVHAYSLVSALEQPRDTSHRVPDPIHFMPNEDDLSNIYSLANLDKNRKWIGIVGALDARKNVPMVLQAALSLNDKSFGIILAGKLDDAIKPDVLPLLQQLEARGIPAFLVDQLLSDGQLDAIIQRLHAVVLAHSNEGPSGILGKAAKAGTIVIAAGARSLKADCRKLPLSSVWSELDVASLATSLNEGIAMTPANPLRLQTIQEFTTRLAKPALRLT